MTPLTPTLEALRLGSPRHHEGLTMFPLFGDKEAPASPAYRLLEEALAAGEVEITEVSEGGHVPELRLENRGHKPVLLLDGEELVGAKQNRVLNLTVLAPPGTTRLPVSCVEAGRWAWRERSFRAAGRTQYAEGRARKVAQVAAYRTASAEALADQHAVWEDIAGKASRLGVRSETGAMADLYEEYTDTIESYVQALPPEPGQLGALFACGRRITGLDLFDHPHTLAHSLPKLVRSQALDAIEHRKEPYRATPRLANPRTFLERLKQARATAFPSPGLGEDLRLQARGVQGAALVWDGRLVHLVAFEQPVTRWIDPEATVWF